MKASGVGFEFLGSILGSTFIGWLIDRYLGTGPWGLVIMIFVGFAVGMVMVWKAMDEPKE
jgi:ATP synthase protein I